MKEALKNGYQNKKNQYLMNNILYYFHQINLMNLINLLET